ncbi:MAG: hypothetical protein IT215_01105, partial [Chitinophagaceae bacterium]|nr:hypothetical protein [Chitinophagaceae bacterium]
MKKTVNVLKRKISIMATISLFLILTNDLLGQDKSLLKLTPQELSNSFGVSREVWDVYNAKTDFLLKEVDEQSFLNYVILAGGGNISDGKYFLEYAKNYIKEDKNLLVYKVGTNEIKDISEIKNYYSSLQPKYLYLYKSFLKNREGLEQSRKKERQERGPTPVPFSCGSPCTNPGFESGTGFWDYSYGDACAGSSSSDPCNLVNGFSTSAHDHTAVADGYDPIVGGTILPVVPPGGGN